MMFVRLCLRDLHLKLKVLQMLSEIDMKCCNGDACNVEVEEEGGNSFEGLVESSSNPNW